MTHLSMRVRDWTPGLIGDVALSPLQLKQIVFQPSYPSD